MTQETPDSVFIQQTLNGQRNAFDQLVQRYKATIFSLALKHLGNFHDAQDIVQEAFLQAYTQLPTLKDASKFGAWLRRITLNLCHAQHRQQKVKWVPLATERDDMNRSGALAYEHTLGRILPETLVCYPNREIERVELREIILKALKTLSETLRATFTLYHIDGFDYREIATRLGVPEGTVKRRLHDARKKFKEEVIMMIGKEFPKLEHAVGMEVWGKEDAGDYTNSIIFGRGIHLPVACTLELTTAKDNQEELYFHIIQGDSLLASMCRSIGEFLIKQITHRKQGEPKINLTLEIDSSGKLKAYAKESPDKPLVVEGKASEIEYMIV
jgi:RNA polymerase sigma-70 factor (ECF subfamily)